MKDASGDKGGESRGRANIHFTQEGTGGKPRYVAEMGRYAQLVAGA
jgi:hypothetical protein